MISLINADTANNLSILGRLEKLKKEEENAEKLKKEALQILNRNIKAAAKKGEFERREVFGMCIGGISREHQNHKYYILEELENVGYTIVKGEDVGEKDNIFYIKWGEKAIENNKIGWFS
jgi:hypothetical protein